MGTDIHGVFQRRDTATQTWVDVPSNFDEPSHYQLFAVLAGVRNGSGFAGVVTGEAVKPIAEPRDLPEDFQVDDELSHSVESVSIFAPWRQGYAERDGDTELKVWMGYHDHSWLTADEMLAWFENAPTVIHTGIISREQYAQWDHKSRPSSYSGGIYGPGIKVVMDNAVEMQATPDWTHVRVEWHSGLKGELAYFFDEVRRLKEEHGEVRFVFGFDS